MDLQKLRLKNLKNTFHPPESDIFFPGMFIVISCEAISGFQATQSPVMVRCLPNERMGRVRKIVEISNQTLTMIV
jgi:carbon starvation protein CstA